MCFIAKASSVRLCTSPTMSGQQSVAGRISPQIVLLIISKGPFIFYEHGGAGGI